MSRRSVRPFTKAQERALIRNWRLDEAWGSSEPIEVEGVIFDLRSKVDTALWRPKAALGAYNGRAALFAPSIVFPWTPADWRKSMLEGGEAIVASRGSTVRVISVVSDPLATPFRQLEPPEARERQLAYIGVESPVGEWRLADRPLVLVAEAATALQVRAGDYAAAYRSLVGKLERRTGIDDLESIIETPKDSWPKVTGPMTQAYADAFIALAEAVKSADEQAYAAFGYMMARAEMELEILPAATRGLQAAATLDLAASARRLEGDRVRSILQSHAAAVIAANPDISLGGCSRLVGARLAADETWTLGSEPKWIQARIKALFELRANGREYRPRRPLEGERSTVKGG